LSLESLRAAIEPSRQALLSHPLYADLHEPRALRVFMEHHVFAVWDFMSLLKGLQQRLCCVSVPWLPNPPSLGSRLINEIVLGEETDEDGNGGYASHFDLYHQAMTRFEARTEPIDRFLGALRGGATIESALQSVEVSPAIRQFVRHTFFELERADLCRIASAFTFGREDLLPDVFQRIVDELARRPDCDLGAFEYYLRRHIELDGGEHGPMAGQLMESLCGDDQSRWQAATSAAVEALQVRLALWDGIHEAIRISRFSQ
jgi:hypothetical protein